MRNGTDFGVGPQPQFRVTLTFVLEDGMALWSAARARLLADAETTDEMVHETIGPPNAPSLADCLAVLCDPAEVLRANPVPGCQADDFWVDAIPGLPGAPVPAAVGLAARGFDG
ncbi:hypothetical protein [Sphingomonas sp. CARO-RG-8B-R24-01]|nr:hypothetical protein [Sphingomonas sp. CARO-RG-8B-R24-01]